MKPTNEPQLGADIFSVEIIFINNRVSVKTSTDEPLESLISRVSQLCSSSIEELNYYDLNSLIFLNLPDLGTWRRHAFDSLYWIISYHLLFEHFFFAKISSYLSRMLSAWAKASVLHDLLAHSFNHYLCVFLGRYILQSELEWKRYWSDQKETNPVITTRTLWSAEHRSIRCSWDVRNLVISEPRRAILILLPRSSRDDIIKKIKSWERTATCQSY